MPESRNRDIARFLGKTEANNPGNVRLTSTADGSGLVVYATKESLPSAGLSSGDQAFVTANSRFYISNGSGWYNVAMINATPTLSISPSGAITLAQDGSTPTVVTLTATDSDNAVAGLSLTVESDGNFGGLATISQDSSVFTITPKAQADATQTNSTLTFKASDGINIASGTTAFSLTFEADWSGGFSLVKNFDEASASQYAQFGSYYMDVTPDGTRLMVCAREDDQTGTTDNIGSIYIYTTTDNWANWTLEQKLQQAGTSNGGVPHIYHGAQGAAISDDGLWIVAGASRYGSGYPLQLTGRVYLWQRSGTTWTQHSNFGSPSGMNYYFGDGGFDFSADASVMAIGHHSNSTNNKGQVYFYTRSGSTWTYRGVEYGRSVQNQRGYFGQGVKVSEDGNWVFVGEYNYWSGSVQAGRIHAYLRSGNSWSYSHSISPANVQYSVGKNFSLNSDATRIAIGAPEYTDGNDTNNHGDYKGGILIYTRTDANATSWTQRAILRNQNIQQYGAPSAGQMGNQGMHMTRDGKFIVAGGTAVFQSGTNANLYGGLDVWKDTSSGGDGTAWTKQASTQGADLSLTNQISEAIAITGDASRVFTTVGDNAQLGSVARNYIKVFKPA
jgi:hypothetical protein